MNRTTATRSAHRSLDTHKVGNSNGYDLFVQIMALLFDIGNRILSSNEITNLKLSKSALLLSQTFSSPSPKGEPKKTIKVIVAGLPRTGTISVKKALGELGYKNCFHLAEPLCQFGNLRRSADIVDTEDSKSRRDKLAHLLEGHEATLEVPGSACLPDLLEMYPEAKVILTQRTSAEVWLRSWRGFGIDLLSDFFRQVGYWVPGVVSANDLYRGFMRLAAERFGLPAPEPSIQMYHAHNDWVKRIVPSERLLVFKCQDGWEPLCSFLGRRRADDFPHCNEAGYLRYYKRVAMALGFVLWLFVIALVLFCLRLLNFK
ncbi:hypothetical protein F5Y01DRAFT_328372 [Xylaria sp. FL0043]|nr:hypothetical protein F5Y01DRAFT_328372 [Xylaria sp. FL0043]